MTQLPETAQSKLEQYLRGDDLNQPIYNPKRKPITHILRGCPKAVTSTIHYLQVIGYASAGDWSPLIPTENPDEVMSILIRHIVIQ